MREILAFVVRHEAVFLRVIHGPVAGERKARLLRIDGYLILRERGLEAIGHSLRIRTENHREVALASEPQLVVALVYLCELLPDHWFQPTVSAALLGSFHFWVHAQRVVIHIHSQRRPGQQRSPFQGHVVREAFTRVDPHLDTLVRRIQRVVFLCQRAERAEQTAHRRHRGWFRKQCHGSTSGR